jgi:hypothetical protein
MRGVFHEQGSSVFDALACGAGPSSAAPSLKQNSSAQAALEVRFLSIFLSTNTHLFKIRVINFVTQISGWIIADRLQQSTVSAGDVRWIERWVQVLESACPDDQTVALRLSAARSLQHAGILSASLGSGAARSAELAAVTLRASLVALTLLQVRCLDIICVISTCQSGKLTTLRCFYSPQDDDDDVREVVNTFLVSGAPVPGDASGEWTVPAGFCTTEVRFWSLSYCQR